MYLNIYHILISPFLHFSGMVHCHRRGSEAIVGDLSHVYLYEQGKFHILRAK